jgi:alkaline phosphatase D
MRCVRPSPKPIDRRSFLRDTTGLLGLSLGFPYINISTAGSAQFPSDPFALGVASGDPLPDAIVLWTRLAPQPMQGGGMPPAAVSVEWQVAADEKMGKVIKRGTATASADMAHSVHVDVRGLEPARWYWYQFRAGSHVSPVGRTRTAPATGSQVDRLKLAFVSCQHYEHGFFVSYRHMAAEDLDLVIHLGDYIYEGAAQTTGVRQHQGGEIKTLQEYRNRHAQYRTDPDLQKSHALFPWIVTWDDHEVDNNYANEAEEHGAPRQEFLARRAAAYKAYYEHMPLRRASLPRGPNMQLYRRLTFGNLAEFSVLDTRQYRTDQPCGDGNKPPCPASLDASATMLGPAQERWLFQGLDRSKARWNVIAQQVMMAQVDRRAGPDKLFSMDQWSGYVEGRNHVLSFLQRRKPANPIVLTGDIHSNWVADLKTDFSDPKSETVGTEFVGSSISSGGDGEDVPAGVQAYLPENPHIRFFNGQRGYVRCALTPGRWQTDYRIVSSVTRQDGTISTRASFVVENGKPGADRA